MEPMSTEEESYANKEQGQVMTCFWGHLLCAELLFEHDPLGCASNGTFSSMLETSLARENRNVTAILLQGAISQNFDAKDLEGAFKYACRMGHSEFVQSVLEHFELSNWPGAFILAADQGRGSVVSALLRNGAELNSRDKNGNLALDIAIQNVRKYRNHVNCTKNPPSWMGVLNILLREGADTDDLTSKIKEKSLMKFLNSPILSSGKH
ncbi:uncharacterized protein N7483_002184 [Penicillium malachiteum]|uniref:uncharacterized protein n=1 Tax=Penicillium malachiteum TaxID=1324776 RepID=UPI0025490008|nr:uncharacterized protein N7483_002184 [Penicillium malachiteum]KAJ5737059.1 hypothetical protein N7483_002184 [Penicillium malachiteum]